MQLAEINFKLGDYAKSEAQVDSILSRATAPNIDAVSKLFAMKLKAFFCSLKGETDRKNSILTELEKLTGCEGCSYHDLGIVRTFFA